MVYQLAVVYKRGKLRDEQAVFHANFELANSANPAKPGETVLIYCTGLGAVARPPEDGAAGNGQPTMLTPEVTMGGTKVTVSFSGLAPGVRWAASGQRGGCRAAPARGYYGGAAAGPAY